MFSTVLIATAVLAQGQAYTWHDIVQPSFQDSTFVGKAVTASAKELKKISSDFAVSYRFLGQEVQAKLKEPFMVRLDATIEETKLQAIYNGDRRVFKIPQNRLSKQENLSDSPGKRETVLDFGILTPSLFENLFDATFIRVDRETGALVFDLTYKRPRFDDSSRQRVWVDKEKRYVTKRLWFAQDGHEMATFLYENPQFQSGVWFPSRAVVKNVDGMVAGVTEYQAVRINSGLADRLFQF
jgi:outer membrane lipoprotein-sorting protein